MKNALLFITGSIVGTAVAVGAIYVIYTNINAKAGETIPVVPKQNLEVAVQANADQNTVRPEQLPQTIVLPELQNAVTSNYKVQLQSVVNSLNTVVNSNNDIILPIMQTLPQKLQSGNWGDVFEEVKRVKVAIKDSTILIKNALTSLSKLDEENKSTTKNKKIYANTDQFIGSSIDFANSFNEYLVSVNALLSGTVPTKEQLSDLNSKIADLHTKIEPFKQNGTNLFLTISELNPENKK